MNLKEFKPIFDEVLTSYISEKTTQSKQLLSNPKLNSFIDYIQSFISSGGKRIRPYCTRIVYKGFGGTEETNILKFSMIFELFHTMALIHDDIIDQSEKRHNIATMHRYITSIIGSQHSHIGEGQAMLIGDLILSRVYELGNKQYNFSENLLEQARQNVHGMIEEVILGQMIDVDMMTEEESSQEMIDKKNKFKTGSYTFIRPMLTGAILAGADQENKDNIITLGDYLGLAFQLRDDLMDIVFGDETKSPFSDIQEGQQTYFTNFIYTQGKEEDKIYLKSCMGRKLNQQEILHLQNMFEQSGAIQSGKELISKYTLQAKEILGKINFTDSIASQGIMNLIEKIEVI